MAFSSRGQGDFREGRFDGEGGMRCDGEAFRPVGPVGDGDGEFPATGNGCVEVKWVAESVEFQRNSRLARIARCSLGGSRR